MRGYFFSTSLAVLLIASAPNAFASWPTSPSDNLPVSTGLENQTGAVACSDGAGGAIVAWMDSRFGFTHIRAQHLRANGTPVWGVDGVALSIVSGNQLLPAIAPDGAGGALVTWIDLRDGTQKLYAQRIGSTGALAWNAGGVRVSTAAGLQLDPRLTSNGAGGAIIVWQAGSETSAEVQAQCLDAVGNPLWTAAGVVVSSLSGTETQARVVSDGAGGAMVAWSRTRVDSSGVYAQRLSPAGARLWGTTPVVLSSGDDFSPTLALAANTSVVIAWHQTSGIDLDVHAQRLDASGAAVWPNGGYTPSGAAGDQFAPVITGDGAGGVIVAWSDTRAGNIDLYARRLTSADVMAWTPDGAVITAASGDQSSPTMVTDDMGGVIVSWIDARNGSNSDVYGQHLSSLGDALWAAGGAPISTAPNVQNQVVAAPAGPGGAIVVWSDARGADYDVYAQHTSYLPDLCAAFTVDFSASPAVGPGPLMVQFTDLTSGGATQWAWDFDDDGTVDATAQNPSHTYAASGTYTVTLTVSNGTCTAARVRANVVHVQGASDIVQWVSDPYLNRPVMTAAGNQERPRACTDGDDGAIVVWTRTASGARTVLAQRVDALGGLRFAAGGVAMIQSGASNPVAPGIVSDDAGGAFVAWFDASSGLVFAQHFDGSGALQWGNTAVRAGTGIPGSASTQAPPGIVSDGAGGAIVVWQDRPTGAPAVLAQRIDSRGIRLWGTNGVRLSPGSFAQTLPCVAPDGLGGAIVAWEDLRSGLSNVYAQRLSSSGATMWSEVRLVGLASRQRRPVIVSDLTGGAIVTWEDERYPSPDLFAQRLGPLGQTRWAADGVPVCVAGNAQTEMAAISDGLGGAIVAWSDGRNDRFDVYAQRMSPGGSMLWGAQGQPVGTTGVGGQARPAVSSDGAGGAIIAWEDYRSALSDIYVQHLGASGTPLWLSTGSLIGGAARSQQSVTSVPSGTGHAIVMWQDPRNLTYFGIYAQHTRYSPVCAPVVTPQFTTADRVGGIPHTVHFTDQSTGPVTQWAWDFESDGVVDDTSQNPIHVYSLIGSYSVTLTVSDGSCPAATTKLNYITATPCTTVTAQFVADTLGNSPFTVHFTDQSTGPITRWMWDFENDGVIDDTSQNPIHVYTIPGYYSVSLTVSDDHCFSQRQRLSYVHVLPCNVVGANFQATPLSGGNPLAVQFTDQSTGPVTSWAWDFQNDGIVDASVQNPSHVYLNPGVYSVSLTVTDGSCVNARVRQNYVTVLRTYRDSVVVSSVTAATPDTARVPILFAGRDSLSAVSLYFTYDENLVSFAGLSGMRPGHTFTGGVRNGRIVVQWFDETGNTNPILAGRDTMFVLVLAHRNRSAQTVPIMVDSAMTRLADVRGNRLTDITVLDQFPYGIVTFPSGAPGNWVISGRIAYYLGGAAVPGANLAFVPDNTGAVSDAAGSYASPPLPTGPHRIRCAKTGDTGGINSLDGLKILRYGAGLETFSSQQLIAADVNRDNLVDALDAIAIVRASLGLAALPVDWRFVPDSIVVTIGAAHLPGQNFTAIRSGDVNGDWAPGTIPMAIVARAEAAESASLSLPDLVVAPGGPVRVPLRVAGLARAGALSLRLRMTGRALAFREVTSQVPGVNVLAHQVGDEIRIEWFDASAGASPPAIGDGTLLTLGFEATGAAGDSCLLEWSAASAVGDPQGAPIAGITWTGGRVRIGDPAATALGRFALHPIAPNPVAIRTALRFTLPRPGRARLDLFDVNGRLVRTLLDGALDAGDHTADFDGRDAHGARLVSGVYVVRLGAAGETRSRKLVLMP